MRMMTEGKAKDNKNRHGAMGITNGRGGKEFYAIDPNDCNGGKCNGQQT